MRELPQRSDFLIVGAGLIGSALAMHLARLGAERVRVIDVDLEGVLSSSELNAGGVRATLEQPVNIRVSQVSIDYFASVAGEIGYRDCGYLWLHSPEALSRATSLHERQRSMGWPVESWDLAELRRRVPFIDKTDGIAGAFFAPRDGLINPNLLKLHYRAEAQRLGARFDDRTRLVGCEPTPGGLRLVCERWDEPSEAIRQAVLAGDAEAWTSVRQNARPVVYEADRVVNCAGAWAMQAAGILGYSSPSRPMRRQVSIFDCRDVDLSPYGMIVDTSGVYFHPEASNGLAGCSTPGEPSGINFRYDGEAFFQEQIWPALYERSSAFERLRHLTGWAGLYEVSPDHSAIVGPVTERVFESHSYSGHGAMHSYGAGLALAERMIWGEYRTLDLTELEGSRFARGRRVPEGAVI